MLEKVKLALRITTDAFDSELTDMIEAAYLDLGLAGVTPVMPEDPLIIRAVTTYCRCHFGDPDNYDRDSFLIAAEAPRFGSGEAKGIVKDSFRR